MQTGGKQKMKLDEAIKGALEYEAGVHRTYKEAMDRATDEKGRRIFEVLCNEEMEHIKYLRERLDEWKSTGKITLKKLETTIPTQAAIDEGVQRLRLQVSEQPAGKHDVELEWLQKALEVEVATSNFYKDMVSQLDGDGQKLFERFVEIEEGHQAIVQAEISCLSGMGFWFDTPEFNLEMG
jgi:rubrerythrin